MCSVIQTEPACSTWTSPSASTSPVELLREAWLAVSTASPWRISTPLVPAARSVLKSYSTQPSLIGSIWYSEGSGGSEKTEHGNPSTASARMNRVRFRVIGRAELTKTREDCQAWKAVAKT